MTLNMCSIKLCFPITIGFLLLTMLVHEVVPHVEEVKVISKQPPQRFTNSIGISFQLIEPGMPSTFKRIAIVSMWQSSELSLSCLL